MIVIIAWATGGSVGKAAAVAVRVLRGCVGLDDVPLPRAGTRRGASAAGRRRELSVAPSLDAAVEALCGDLRTIKAPHGSELNARSWSTEAPLRMLLNNLDAEVAERPEDLVVYGGSGRAARSHEALKAIVKALLELGDDETLLVQSGKPVAVFRTTTERAACADRELAARARSGRPGTSSGGSRPRG